MNIKTTRIKVSEKIAYALGDTAANITWRALTTFLIVFYTDVFGLKPEDAGLVMLATRFLDGITDVIMGMICDRTNTRWGKFRPWILWSTLPFGLLLILTFSVPDLSYNNKLIWAFVTYFLLTLAYTANNVPYSALMGAMTSDPQERTSISSFRFAGAYLGGIISQVGLVYLVAYFGGGYNEAGEIADKAAGYQNSMYILAALMVIFLLCTFFGTKERVKVQNDNSGIKSVGRDIKDLVKNKPWWILLVVAFLFCTYNNIKQSMAVYYFQRYIGNAELVAGYMLGLLAVSVIASLFAPALTRRFGKKNLFVYCMLFSGLANALMWFASPENLVYIFTTGILSEAGAAIMPVLFFSMLGDAADYSQWRYGRRATGLVYSAGTLSMKFGGGAAGAIIGFVLAMYNYDPSSTEMVSNAIPGIRLLMTVIPALFIAISSILVLFYPLNTKKMNEISKCISEESDSIA